MSTNTGLRKTFALLPTCVLTGLLFAGLGCGDSTECVVDTDCELGNRCDEQVCVPLNVVPERDTGPAPDGDVEDTSPEPDVGPPDVGVDAGPEEDAGELVDGAVDAIESDSGPVPVCDFDGTYTATPGVGNPPLCGALALTECVFETVDGITTASCGEVMSTCTYDADCLCTGMSTSDITVRADFPRLALEVESTSAGAICRYTLTI
ncbi:MAG: hypothetical protein ACI9KE_002873 [Polyangiales bacterium]|jgi:hypothetical protein